MGLGGRGGLFPANLGWQATHDAKTIAESIDDE